MLRLFLPLALALSVLSPPLAAQTPEAAQPPDAAPPEVTVPGPMTPDRLVAILLRLDPEAGPRAGGIGLTISDVPVIVFMDPSANRMRAVVPVASAEGLGPDDMRRVLQANFDTALDARYAIAEGRLWSTYIHPLAELQPGQLISGLAQTVILAQTYGTAYASGSVAFGAGDSPERFRQLMEELLERGEEL
jgi:hypothetical protein